ncbi:MAG: beta-galactosidase [Pseudomonadota bacterium]
MFGVCYYPEHWPEAMWADDARRMAELGLEVVRLAEFAWSRIEPERDRFEFDWLDRAIDVLAAEGLKVVLCTPTATPPKWLIDEHPDILPRDPESGLTRGFGSRRHYDFSSPVYLAESERISTIIAARYGQHPAVVGWQTDNELCCHDTTLSGSASARTGFQRWCRETYGTIDALNNAWGTVFWSMEYRRFEDIELPLYAVTECSPSHQLAFRRYASDAVVQFHQRQVDIIREHAPQRFVTHNFIPPVDTGVDNAALAAPLDFPSYDNYPLGRSDLRFKHWSPERFGDIMRTGHPDFSAYTFDQIRGLQRTGFWVMEQQPGPVNWADANPKPLPGMVRLWTWEAVAHGADVVSYFRWRQAPFAQEQMHAGLRRPDDSPSETWPEIEATIREILDLGVMNEAQRHADVAMITDAHGYWLSDIEKQHASLTFDDVQFDVYRALRALGINIDIVSPQADLSAYRLVVVPCLPVVDASFVEQAQRVLAQFVFLPRCGSKTDQFNLPGALPPGALQALLPIKVSSVETLRPDCSEALNIDDQVFASRLWRETLLIGDDVDIVARYGDNEAAAVRKDRFTYIATLSCRGFLEHLFRSSCDELGIETSQPSSALRLRQRGRYQFALNYGSTTAELPLNDDDTLLVGRQPLSPHDVAVWRKD